MTRVWHVVLEQDLDGEPPGEPYSLGLRIRDRREGAHDLIAEANKRWGSNVVGGEVYSITDDEDAVRRYRVIDDPNNVEGFRLAPL
jgi:hypothetical protein